MIVKLNAAWKKWPAGHVIPEMPDNVARALIARRIAEEVKTYQSPLNRMMSNVNHKKPKLSLRS